MIEYATSLFSEFEDLDHIYDSASDLEAMVVSANLSLTEEEMGYDAEGVGQIIGDIARKLIEMALNVFRFIKDKIMELVAWFHNLTHKRQIRNMQTIQERISNNLNAIQNIPKDVTVNTYDWFLGFKDGTPVAFMYTSISQLSERINKCLSVGRIGMTQNLEFILDEKSDTLRDYEGSKGNRANTLSSNLDVKLGNIKDYSDIEHSLMRGGGNVKGFGGSDGKKIAEALKNPMDLRDKLLHAYVLPAQKSGKYVPKKVQNIIDEGAILYMDPPKVKPRKIPVRDIINDYTSLIIQAGWSAEEDAYIKDTVRQLKDEMRLIDRTIGDIEKLRTKVDYTIVTKANTATGQRIDPTINMAIRGFKELAKVYQVAMKIPVVNQSINKQRSDDLFKALHLAVKYIK
jgi:hypothetical protein